MPLIDTSYFDGLTGLDNITTEAVNAAVSNAITRYEDEYLRLMLGPSLYDAFMAGLESGNRSYFSSRFSDRFLKSPLDDRWRWLRDGYTFAATDGRTYGWTGLVNASKVSPIAHYVYFKYRADNRSRPTPNGDFVPKSENADRASLMPRLVEVWNRMVEMNRTLYMLIAGTTLYPEYEAPTDRCDIRRDLLIHVNEHNI